MVCVPCIFIPVLLWVFHKWIQPFVLKFWNPWKNKGVTENGTITQEDLQTKEAIYIKKKIADNPVMVFSKTTCSFSKMAKKVLNEIGVNYELEEIEGREDCNDLQDVFQKMTGARTVPRVFVGGECLGGGSEIWSLHNQGGLIPKCKEAGATFKKTD